MPGPVLRVPRLLTAYLVLHALVGCVVTGHRKLQVGSPVQRMLSLSGEGEPARRRASEASHDEHEAGADLEMTALIHHKRKTSLASLLTIPHGGGGAATHSSSAATIKTLLTFGLWFALNVYYNIVNKKVLNALPLPYSIATVQLAVGAVYVMACWLVRVRRQPRVSQEGLKSLMPIALFHATGQLFTVMSLGAGAVSFTHIVKALEPFFSAVVAAIAFKEIFKPQVYAALIPVVAGVSIACATEVSFSWLSFATAMASNLAFTLRANYSKFSMVVFKKEDNKTMDAANLYAVVTILSFGLLLPVAILAEYSTALPAWDRAVAKLGQKKVALDVLLSGIFHYLNNEVMYLALDQVHPITLAVGNTAKRVFIIVASLLVFQNPISLLGGIGSAIGIGGVLLYSLTKAHYDKLKSAPPSPSPK